MELLKKKNVVITGGSDGIGFGIARAFAQHGANLVLIGRDMEKLEQAKSTLVPYGTQIFPLQADLTRTERLENIKDDIIRHFSCVDVLVNNAGVGRFTSFSETTETLLDVQLTLNVKAPYLLTQQLLPSLIETKGNVINISSYFADRMLSGRTTTAYSMTKGAINSFTKSLAFEVGHLGVRVNAIAPGTVRTTQFERNMEELSEKGQSAFYDMVKTIYPLGDIGHIDDVGRAACFLASEQASWITGSILAVDGGLTTN